MTSRNYVGELKEYADKKGWVLRFDEVGCAAQDNITTFTLRAVLNGKEYPEAVGKKKKEAKQKAAENALNNLEDDTVFVQKENISEASTSKVLPEVRNNFMCWLNEYCQKEGVSFKPVETPKSGPNCTTQWCYIVVDGKEYTGAYGKTKKEAKEEAAKQVYNEICQSKTTEVASTSALSNEGAAMEMSTPPRTQDSGCAKTSIPATPSDSAAFTNSSKPRKEEVQSPIVKPKIKLAANFRNAQRASIQDVPNFKRDNAENIEQEKTSTRSKDSRFMSEYDSIELLGKGAFGRVFKAKQKLLGKDFAIKIVRYKETAVREMKALSDLHHANVVRYYTSWLEDCDYQCESSSESCGTSESSSEYSGKYLYIQMELCDAKTLRVWIDEKNIQNVKKSLRNSKRKDESLTFAQQIVSGVEYIHSKLFFHRDLKPANILFGLDGGLKIGDFGLVAAESNDGDNLVERSEYKGTPSYMAPEQKAKTTYDRKVDIFALGLIYFEMLWNISTGHERVVIWGEARDQKLPQEFCQRFRQESLIIKSMLRKNPEDRPEASQLKEELEKFSHASEADERRTC